MRKETHRHSHTHTHSLPASSFPATLLSPTFLIQSAGRKGPGKLLKGQTDLMGLIVSPSRREIILLSWQEASSAPEERKEIDGIQDCQCRYTLGSY